MVEAFIALGAAVFGGAGLKSVEYLLNRSKDKADFATELRNELREDLTTLRERYDETKQQRDEYHEKAYKLELENHRLELRLIRAISIIQAVIDECDLGVQDKTFDRAKRFLSE